SFNSMNSTIAIVSWVPEPEGRGTIGLVWSCLVTIFLCTWSAIHPNLPAPTDSQLRRFGRHVGHVFIALVAPEYTVLFAVEHFLMARKSPGWSLLQCFFLTMGGYALQTISDTEDEPPVRIKPQQLVSYFESGKLAWPEVSVSDIEDRSKADWIVKLVTLVQVTWFVAQVIGRALQGLTVTTLELFTLGNVFCAAVMYILWWHKPFDVRTPIVLRIKSPLPELAHVISIVDLEDTLPKKRRIPGWSTIAATLVFGGLLVVGWQFHFPSSVEELLWRISSIGVITLSLVAALMAWSVNVVNLLWWEKTFARFVVISMVLYTLLRLYMFVEMFIGLRAVPADVYKTPQWSQYFPSFG
ncbi:hypothetical protein P153DRAFT_292789, partial [Dothidotthia symphoricarpi CBS 119687]